VRAPVNFPGTKPSTLSARRHCEFIRAFSLVEVVIAIAVLSFCLVVVTAMLGEGLSNNQDSSRRLQQADIASLLLSTRRAAPTNPNLTNFALPVLGATNGLGQVTVAATTNYAKVQIDGTTNAAAQGVFNLRYIITPSGARNNIANVDLVLWGPPTLAASGLTLPTNNPASYYELMTQVALP